MIGERQENQLDDQLKTIAEKCINCDLCQQECRFLQKFGKPGEIGAAYDPSREACLTMPFECSLCALCDAVCPVGIKPSQMFFEMRKASIRKDASTYGTDCVYLGYESRGTSKHLSYYALPRHCSTIYFPGCAYPAGRPRETVKLFNFLQRAVPGLGIVLDCCTKPSHDLGRIAGFNAMFGEMRSFLLQHGIRKVLVNCPNCYKIFQAYGRGLAVETVYEVMAAANLKANHVHAKAVTVHDPCVLRGKNSIQETVRELLRKSGVHLSEMKHNRDQTICCGEGGSVSCRSSELADRWVDLRLVEAAGKPMITYCSGCVNRFARRHPTTHILDLFFGSGNGSGKQAFLPGFPLTCINRIRLKNYLKRNIQAVVTRERTFSHESISRMPLLNRNRLAYFISIGLAKLLGR